jgi:hypothetical protein
LGEAGARDAQGVIAHLDHDAIERGDWNQINHESLLEGIVPFHHRFYLEGLKARERNETLLEYTVNLGTNGEAANPFCHHRLVNQDDLVVAADDVDGVDCSVATVVNDGWGKGVVAVTPTVIFNVRERRNVELADPSIGSLAAAVKMTGDEIAPPSEACSASPNI